MDSQKTVLVTGTTGYIGGRLAPLLLKEGYQVRVLVRDPYGLQGRSWVDQVEIATGDVLQPGSLRGPLEGVTAAYYLIHSMKGGSDFYERDLTAARNFAAQAREAGVQRIIYLGGLGDPETDLSKHLRSRQETGIALAGSGVPVTELRAGVVVGAGSISFEMIRYLTERVPVMICPRWVFTRTQPISIRNVLDYLVAALHLQDAENRIIEVGGPDAMTYGEMLEGYARLRGLKRWLLPVPVLSPRLSSYWVHWVTPIPATIARPLVEGLRNEAIVRNDTAQQLFPKIRLDSYQEAVKEALSTLEAREVETAWSDALATSQGDVSPIRLSVQEGMIIERRMLETPVTTEKVYQAFTSLGGENGWLYANWAWRLRGWVDWLVGGVGFRRGRRDPARLRAGDALDFWRVESLLPGEKVLLRAEMKVPGRSWLQFEAVPLDENKTRLIQTAFFAPKGLAGFLYWYMLYPIHAQIFSGLIRELAREAERKSPETFVI